MKDRMERLVVLPFTAGCVSSSSVSVSIQHRRRPKDNTNSSHTVCTSKEVAKDASSSDEMMKASVLSKPNIYNIGFHRFTRSIRNLSHSLVFKEEMEELEIEMEIGLPTDVKHVTHIGFDGPLTPGSNGYNHLVVSDLLSLCPNSMPHDEQRTTLVPTNSTHCIQITQCKSPDENDK